jgi:hypothetical protein
MRRHLSSVAARLKCRFYDGHGLGDQKASGDVREYVYDRLAEVEESSRWGSTRLIKILPTLDDGLIQCQLSRENIFSSRYIAISYSWGPKENPRLVKVNGRRFEVRENLWDFQDHARRHLSQEYLWIDAICTYLDRS